MNSNTKSPMIEEINKAINEGDSRLLHIIALTAVSGGHVHVMDHLMSLGYDLIGKHSRYVADSGNLTTAEYFLKRGVNVFKGHRTLMCRFAITHGSLNVIKWMVEHDCDPTEPDNLPVRFAHEARNFEVARYLVSVGAWHDSLDPDEYADAIASRVDANLF